MGSLQISFIQDLKKLFKHKCTRFGGGSFDPIIVLEQYMGLIGGIRAEYVRCHKCHKLYLKLLMTRVGETNIEYLRPGEIIGRFGFRQEEEDELLSILNVVDISKLSEPLVDTRNHIRELAKKKFKELQNECT